MHHRPVLGLVLSAAVAIAACGDDDQQSPVAPSTLPTAPTTAMAPATTPAGMPTGQPGAANMAPGMNPGGLPGQPGQPGQPGIFNADAPTTMSSDTPTNVQAVSTAAGADISWNNVPGNATYTVRFQTMGTGWHNLICTQFAPCESTNGRTTFSFNVQNSSAMEYAFQVRASTNGATGPWVPDPPVTAMAPVPPPPAPTGVTANATASGLAVRWAKSEGADNYRIRYATNGGSWTVADCANVTCSELSGNRMIYRPELDERHEYSVQVKAFTGSSASEWGPTTAVTVIAPRIGSPSNLSAVAHRDGFTARFVDGQYADNHKLRYRTGNESWTEVDCHEGGACRVNNGRTIVRVNGLGETAHSTYQVQAMAYGFDGTETDWIDTTVDAPVRTAPPTGVTARGRKHMAVVRFNRIDGDNGGVDYFVRVRINGQSTSISCNNGNSAHCTPTGNPNIIRATVRSLPPGTGEFDVAAQRGQNGSAWGPSPPVTAVIAD